MNMWRRIKRSGIKTTNTYYYNSSHPTTRKILLRSVGVGQHYLLPHELTSTIIEERRVTLSQTSKNINTLSTVSGEINSLIRTYNPFLSEPSQQKSPSKQETLAV